MKFSIIVPVYNVESYLAQCIESIIAQSYNYFELILVDDGSQDTSPQICDMYSKQDNRIKVIHKKNGGLSSARNAGLDISVGEYIIFVDSDDWISDNCLDIFAQTLIKHPVDLLMTVKTSVYDNIQFPEVEGIDEYVRQGFDKNRAVQWILYNCKSMGAPNKIVKREIIEANKMRFFEGALHEDIDWTFKLCINASSFYGISTQWYNYRMIRDGSITAKITTKNITSVFDTAIIYYNNYLNNKNGLNKEIYHRVMDAVYVSLNRIKLLNDEDVDKIINYLTSHINFMRFGRKPEQVLFMIAYNILGPRMAIRILTKI